MGRILKLGCGGLIVLFVLAAIGGALSGGKSATPTPLSQAQLPLATATSAAPTIKPTATPAPPTATPGPKGALAQVAQGQFRDKLKKAVLSDINVSDFERLLQGTPVAEGAPAKPGDKVLVYAAVDYDLGTQWDEGTAIRSATLDLVQFAPKVFAIATVDALELRAFTEFTDVYGKTKDDVAIKFTVSRATANKVNWPGIDRKNLGIILSDEGDGIYVHPGLQKAWLEYTSR